MIWVLLEITLPLCLAFLFGLGAGWLFWRWRRRSISQAEWNNQANSSAVDTLKLNALKEESSSYKQRMERLDTTVKEQSNELRETKKRTQSLSNELAAANDKLATMTEGNSDKKPQDTLAQEKQQSSKIQELEYRSSNLQKTVDRQSDELQQFSKIIKKQDTELKAANEQLASQNINVSNEEFLELQSKLSSITTEKAETDQKFQQVLNDTKLQKNIATELQTNCDKLESIIERQADELLETKKNNLKLTDDIATFQKQLTDANKSKEDELRDLQGKLDTTITEKENIEQQLKDSSEEVSQKNNTVSELQAALENLEKTLQKQSSELQEADKKLQYTDDLKARVETLEKQTHQSEDDLQALQSELKEISAQKDQLTENLQDATSRVEQKTKLSDELQQKLKQSETVTTERDTAITRIKQLEDELTAAYLKTNNLEETKIQFEQVDRKFKSFQSSAAADRQAREEQLSKQKARIEALEAALAKEKEKLADLNKLIDEKTRELSKNNEANTDAKRMQSEQFSKQVTDLQHQLDQATKEIKELDDARIKLAEVTTQLSNARARNNQLVSRIESTPTPAAVTSITVGQVSKLKTVVAEKEKQIEELEKKLKARSEKVKSSKNKKSLSWQKGQTKIGTPGCDHKDDLTVISGIGPKIEKTLNQLGIKSWEQLATLKVAEVKLVDEKLVEFPGRIKRDEWVAQAKAIIRNGHKPLDKATEKVKKKPKKPSKAKAAKNSWQKGKTKFDTPGSAHQDDLKVINGIGPVIEKSLKSSGIQSWEQLASLKAKEVKTIDDALDFPGRIAREQWVAQAKALVKQFPDRDQRPTRRTFLNQAVGQ